MRQRPVMEIVIETHFIIDFLVSLFLLFDALTLIRRLLQVRQPVRDFSWARLTAFVTFFLVFWDGSGIEEAT